MEWFNNIESSNEQTNEVVQEQELDLWHQEILENYEYKDMFIDFIYFNIFNIRNQKDKVGFYSQSLFQYHLQLRSYLVYLLFD